MSSHKLFLIDAHALCYSSFYAIRELTNSHGQPTNAVYGFVSTLRKILREYKPEFVAVCFDSHKKTLREEKFKAYKIQRKPMPDGLIPQIPIIKDVMAAYGLKIFELGGYEADDLIATIATKASGIKNLEIVIVSEDKDMFQLSEDHIKFYSTRKDLIFGAKEIEERFGFKPKRIIDYISLAGDSTDNIPGVNGIGEVTAKSLIKEYGDLDGILKNVDSIKSQKVKEKLINQRDQALLCRELALLETKVPVEVDLKDLKIQPADKKWLLKKFKKLEFKRFSEELMGAVNPKSATSIQEAIVVDDKKAWDKLLDAITKENAVAFMVDCENDKKDIYLGVKTNVYQMKSSYYKELSKIFSDEKIVKVTFDLKKSLNALDKLNCRPNNVFDVMLACFLSGNVAKVNSINSLVWAYDHESWGEDTPISRQVGYLMKIYAVLKRELAEKSLDELLADVEMPLAFVLHKMESHGVHLDLKLLSDMSRECEKKINDLTAKLYKMAGEEFNVNSPKQLSHILFEVLKLPVVKRTKTGFSTDEEVLSTLAANHEFPSLLLEYRQLAKLKSTYIDALPQMVDKTTGRIHAEFDQIGAETGRLSSRNPNLQNIPIRTELGRQIRKAFIPSDKQKILISADYSQIELRILAHLSKDKTLKKAFEEDQDIHEYTASLIFDVKDKKIDYHMRDTAKRINFGIVYGMSAFGLSKDLGIRQDEAQDFIDRYFLRYPGVKTFMEKTIEECEEKGYVTTLLKRRRYIPEINNKNMAIRQFAQRQAINTPVQGSAADLMKLTMIHVDQAITKNKLGARMLITVHDELVLESDKNQSKETMDLVKNVMEGSFKLSVPIKVSAKSGPNWLDMK